MRNYAGEFLETRGEQGRRRIDRDLRPFRTAPPQRRLQCAAVGTGSRRRSGDRRLLVCLGPPRRVPLHRLRAIAASIHTSETATGPPTPRPTILDRRRGHQSYGRSHSPQCSKYSPATRTRVSITRGFCRLDRGEQNSIKLNKSI